MKILVNCAGLNSTGPLQVALSFINECKNINNEYFIICGPAFENIIDPNNYSPNFFFYYTKVRIISGLMNFLKVRRLIKNIEKEISPDVVFTVFGPAYWKPATRHVQGFATPQVFYPESQFFKLISVKERIWWYFHRKVNLFLLRYEAKEFILETDIMEQRLKDKIPSCTTYVVPNTFSEIYNKFNLKNQKDIEEGGEFKMLTLCSYKRHKNLEIIPQVVDILLELGYDAVRFYLTLKDNKYLELVSEKYRKFIINLGPLHPNICPVAYSSVDAMFLPTLLESFSASYPEAMKMGKPILTSSYDFATTVCGDAAIYFDPLNPQSAAAAIVQLIDNPKLYQSLIEKGRNRLNTFGNAATRAHSYLEILASHE